MANEEHDDNTVYKVAVDREAQRSIGPEHRENPERRGHRAPRALRS
ncbi:hypothetical protein [Sorangium sp. So ce204]